MATCPNCGEIVMEGDPYCSNCGTTFRWVDDDNEENHYSSGGRHYTPPVRTTEDVLSSYANSYARNLEWARKETEDREIIRYYNYALDYGKRFWDLAEREAIITSRIPKRTALLDASDVERCSKRHYELLGKYGILTDYETPRNGYVELLKRSGNSNVISQNERQWNEHLRVQRQVNAENHERWCVKNARESYFKNLEKANEAVAKNSHKKAMGNYRKAIDNHKDYFSRDYNKYDSSDSKMMPQPPEIFTDEAVYYLLEMYKRTHPLLKSSKKDLEINSEIADMLNDLHADELKAADEEAQRIFRQKQAKRQKQISQVEDAVVDGVVAARVIGNEIFNRIRNR